jgi:hypothetical protein
MFDERSREIILALAAAGAMGPAAPLKGNVLAQALCEDQLGSTTRTLLASLVGRGIVANRMHMGYYVTSREWVELAREDPAGGLP